MRHFSVKLASERGSELALGHRAQASLRIGDGKKWSAWQDTKDQVLALPPPRRAKPTDEAAVSQAGRRCILSWPPPSAPDSVDAIEYQVRVIPDSEVLKPRIVALKTSVPSNQPQEKFASPVGEASLSSLAQRLAPNSDSSLSSDSTKLFSKMATRVMRGTRTRVPDESPTSSGSKRWMSQAVTHEDGVDTSAAEKEDPRVSVEIAGLLDHVRYHFEVGARYPTVGPRECTPLFEVRDFTLAKAEASEGDGTSPRSLGRHRSMLQAPEEVPWAEACFPDLAGEAFVALTLPGAPSLEVLGESLELQVADASEQNAESGAAWLACPAEDLEAHTLEGDRACLVVRRLPVALARFRLRDLQTESCGPPTEDLATAYAAIEAAPAPSLQVLGVDAARGLGVRLEWDLNLLGGSHDLVTHCYVRFRAAGAEDAWVDVEPMVLGAHAEEAVSFLVREEDGLELGVSYAFQAAVGSSSRRSPWSDESAQLLLLPLFLYGQMYHSLDCRPSIVSSGYLCGAP